MACTIQSLTNTPVEAVFEAFAEAFADYDRQWTYQEFLKMLQRRDYNAAISYGAFIDGVLVSFTLNGLRQHNGILTGYDTGTGTIKEFRGKGLASVIFGNVVPALRELGVSQYLLEVLQHNKPAVSIYQKAGFRTNRELLYFLVPVEKILSLPAVAAPGIEIRNMETPDMETAKAMWQYQPSWQNTFDALAHCPEDFSNFGAWQGGELLGYGIVEPATGDVPQLAVRPQSRRQGIGSVILRQLALQSNCGRLKLLNTDKSCKEMTAFLQAVGIEPAGAQFEMILDI